MVSRIRFVAVLALLCLPLGAALAGEMVLHTFEKIVLTEQFFCEGANYGDFNQDGKMDIVAGPYWYEGPDFKVKHEYYPAKPLKKENYSENFFTWVYDFNGDKYPDILVVGMPGLPGYWYENPKGKDGMWVKHKIFDVVDSESPGFGDINGDGKPELICTFAGQLGWAAADWADAAKPWKFHAVSAKGKWHKYSHGLGWGDVNGDGKMDMLEGEEKAWWEQQADPAAMWVKHPQDFGSGAQILVYDVNGDGLNDVITSLSAHQYGLAWFEQVKADNQITFKKHLIMGSKPEENKYGVKFSQPHALDLVDMDGDGVKDFVVGKRHWAHGPQGDPESQAPAVLYWFRTVRSKDGVEFVPYLIDNDSGVGTQVVTGDVNGDGLPDVVVGNKRGCFVFIHKTQKVSQEEWEKAQPKLLKP
ncbi:MAG: FG-GAP-like repeat-containing protein [Planctomycetota bacterium]|nr:FG-GAP-like repeat-containing protein [Planctomycetota bacterium]